MVVIARTPLQILAGLRDRREALDSEIARMVAAARKSGASWREIGDALGISPQAGRARYRDIPLGEAAHPMPVGEFVVGDREISEIF